jgi:hypothetical protein
MMNKRRGWEVLGKEEITFRTNGRKKANGKGEKTDKENRRKEFEKPIGPGVLELDVIKSSNEKKT